MINIALNLGAGYLACRQANWITQRPTHSATDVIALALTASTMMLGMFVFPVVTGPVGVALALRDGIKTVKFIKEIKAP